MKLPPWKKGISKEKYLRLIDEHFPDVSYKKSRIIRHGYDNIVIILDEVTVFRFPSDSYLSRFKAEVRLLEKLSSRVSAPVPHYMYRMKDDSFGGYKKLDGMFMKKTAFRALPKTSKKALATELGKFLTELHAVPTSVARTAGFVEENDYYWWSKKRAEKNLKLMQQKLFPKLTKIEAAWIEKKYREYVSLSFDFKPVITHSDLVGDHILFDAKKKKISGVIDFADVEIGDPAIDFRRLWEFGEEFFQNVLSSYGGTVDRDFVQRSKFPRTVACVPHLLDAVTGKKVYYSFEENRKFLRGLMKKYP